MVYHDPDLVQYVYGKCSPDHSQKERISGQTLSGSYTVRENLWSSIIRIRYGSIYARTLSGSCTVSEDLR